ESRKHDTKFPAKEKFYADLSRYLQESFTADDRRLVMADRNSSPACTGIGIGAPNGVRCPNSGKCSSLAEERDWWQRLLGFGLQDTYRKHHPDSMERFSWFDYRSKGFDDEPKRGLRIDHILATAPVAAECTAVGIGYEVRGMEKPSDHAPVWATFS